MWAHTHYLIIRYALCSAVEGFKLQLWSYYCILWLHWIPWTSSWGHGTKPASLLRSVCFFESTRLAWHFHKPPQWWIASRGGNSSVVFHVKWPRPTAAEKIVDLELQWILHLGLNMTSTLSLQKCCTSITQHLVKSVYPCSAFSGLIPLMVAHIDNKSLLTKFEGRMIE